MNASSLKPTAVNAILTEVRALTAQGRTFISLMRGEPDFRTPEHIVEAAIKALRDGRTTYPDQRGELNLRKAVAAHIPYDPATEILITDGATLGIHCALTALLEEGDEVLLPDPIYDAYQSPIRLAGGVPVPVRSTLTNGRFSLPLESFEAAATPKTKLLILNAPWNPVGTVFTQAELEAIAGFISSRNLTIVSDEIYEKITYAGHPHISIAPLIRDRTIIVNSFSKTYAMTGWRLGYCAAPAPMIQSMAMVLAQSSRGPATFIQDAGAAALSGPQDCVAQMLDVYTRRRTLVLEKLPKAMAPEGGFFAMLDIRDTGMTSDQARRKLLDAGVVVIHGAAYGPGGEGTLRVAFASGLNLAEGLDRLNDAL